MVDEAATVKKDKLGEAFGVADDATMLEGERCLAVYLGIAKQFHFSFALKIVTAIA